MTTLAHQELASHVQRVALRWESLQTRLEQKMHGMQWDRTAEARLLGRARSAGSRAKKIFWLRQAAQTVADNAASHVACRQGCSHCCHIAVVVSSAEALQIAAETGVHLDADAGSQVNGEEGSAAVLTERWAGTACPFLRDSSCSIYASRPLACRLQFNMDDDDLLCQLVDGEATRAPYLDLGVHHIAAAATLGVHQKLADIRQWFPQGSSK